MSGTETNRETRSASGTEPVGTADTETDRDSDTPRNPETDGATGTKPSHMTEGVSTEATRETSSPVAHAPEAAVTAGTHAEPGPEPTSETGTDIPRTRAPDFPDGLMWFNTESPLNLADMSGKFILLDFWTYCCLNCLHNLGDLERLEADFPEELVVIGVHSAKFPNEKDDQNLEAALQRHGIRHPIVADPDFIVWSAYAVRAWPTLFLIDPAGYVVGYWTGEGAYEPLAETLRERIPEAEARGELSRERLPFQRARLIETPIVPAASRGATVVRRAASHLSFPGGIDVHPTKEILYIADSNHHRILVTDFDGDLIAQIGSGNAGLADGPRDLAEFRQPQGLAVDTRRRALFVADTGNHALRVVDLDSGAVQTLAGNGRQAPSGATEARGPRDPLNSPWDLALHEGKLFVAMAGAHQIWRFKILGGYGRAMVGTGEENLHDGLLPDALLAPTLRNRW